MTLGRRVRIAGQILKSYDLLRRKLRPNALNHQMTLTQQLSRSFPKRVIDYIEKEIITDSAPKVVLQPSAQCVQVVPTWFISHGRVLYR